MLVVEFRLDSPLLQDALARVPEATVTMEELYRTEESIVVHFWVEGGDLDAFERALASDPTVADADELTETESRRLYRATCTDYGRSNITFPSWSELDVSFLEATATCEGWEAELRMPDRTTLQSYVRVCQERELQFQLRSVYEERAAGTGVETQLTERQRKTLLVAHELGYFDVPRGASLADVAAECDVTPQATSERLRRATGNLVETTLVPKTA